MKKEVFLAIAIGFALGLVITFGIWTANKSLKNLPKTGPTPTTSAGEATPTSTSATNPPASVSLTITAPEDEALTTTNKATVSGTTVANATVVIFSENNQQLISADGKGNFTAEVTLVGGYNIIRVDAFDSSGNMAEKAITVTYTTAKI